MATYVPAPTVENIAKSLINRYTHNLGELNVEKIGFLWEIDTEPKTKLAVTKKVDSALKIYYSEKDYIIIFYQKLWDTLVPAQQHILVFHELLHCEPLGEKLRDHDIKDFYEIGGTFGINWASNPLVQDPLYKDKIDIVVKPINYASDDD